MTLIDHRWLDDADPCGWDVPPLSVEQDSDLAGLYRHLNGVNDFGNGPASVTVKGL